MALKDKPNYRKSIDEEVQIKKEDIIFLRKEKQWEAEKIKYLIKDGKWRQ